MSSTSQTDVEPTTSDEKLPEPYETRLTDAGKASMSAKRAVGLELDRRRDPLASAGEIESEIEGIGRKTVERALKGLQTDDIVLKRDGSTDLWYLKHPESEYAVPPDITVSEKEGFDLLQALTLQNTAAILKIGLFLMSASVIGTIASAVLTGLGVSAFQGSSEQASELFQIGLWLLLAAATIQGLKEILGPTGRTLREYLSGEE